MAAELTAYQADGTTELVDGVIPTFGVVPTGTTTADKIIKLKNTGDATAYDIQLRIVQASAADGELIGECNAVTITDDWVQVAAELEAGDTLDITLNWTVPALATPPATDTATLEASHY
jgi:hypothetical protein